MTRWKEDTTEFTVSVMHSKHRNLITIPKPVLEFLNNPESVTYKLHNGEIIISTQNKEKS